MIACFSMPKNGRCEVGYCDNDKRYPEYVLQRSHVSELVFHKWPKDPNLAETWRKQVVKSSSDDFNSVLGAQGTYVCSNNFPLGKITPTNPEADYPSVFLMLSEHFHSNTPKKGRRNRLEEERSCNPRRSLAVGEENEDAQGETSGSSNDEENDPSITIPMRFEQLTREFDVKFYTGLPSTQAFKCLFE